MRVLAVLAAAALCGAAAAAAPERSAELSPEVRGRGPPPLLRRLRFASLNAPQAGPNQASSPKAIAHSAGEVVARSEREQGKLAGRVREVGCGPLASPLPASPTAPALCLRPAIAPDVLG